MEILSTSEIQLPEDANKWVPLETTINKNKDMSHNLALWRGFSSLGKARQKSIQFMHFPYCKAKYQVISLPDKNRSTI